MLDQSQLAAKRSIQARFDNLDVTCFPTHFDGVEAINRPFLFEMEMVVPIDCIDVNALVANVVDVQLGKGDNTRVLNGLVYKCSKHAVNYRGYQLYRFTLVPWLYYLNLTSNCRIFQDQSPIDIFKTICKGYDFLWFDTSELTQTYEAIPYCTQYNESDADFIDRLFQKYGISYVFKHEQGKHTMVLFDQTAACPSCGDKFVFDRKLQMPNALHEWTQSASWGTNQVTLADFNYQHASAPLSGASQSNQNLTVLTNSNYEHFEYPGRFQSNAEGTSQALQKTSAQSFANNLIYSESNSLLLMPGNSFTLIQHPQSSQQGKYFITTIKHEAEDYTGLPFAHNNKKYKRYVNYPTCFSAINRYAPLATIAWPKITGPQTAIVVGVEKQTAYPEKYTQVKVQFHWDRQGDYNPNSSCWIRTGQFYGGANHGMQFTPRAGTEVIVDFINGDPDRPQIVGMRPNANNPLPFPTKDNPNISGIKTQTPGNPLAFNELSFDDSKGAQKANIQAQNTLNLTAKGKEKTTIGGNLTHTVAGDHVHNSHSSITYKAKNQLTVNAGATQIQMTPSQVTIKTPSLSTGMPGNAASLPAMMPTYNKSQGSDQTQNTQPQQSNNTTDPKQIAFLLDMKGVDGDFKTNVNNLNTTALPIGSQKLYKLKPVQYSGDLHIKYNNTLYGLGSVESLHFNKKNIAPIYIGQRTQKAKSKQDFEQQQDNAYNDQIDNLFMVKAMSTAPATLNDGAHDTQTANQSTLNWLSAQLNNPAKKEAVNTAAEAVAMAAKNRKFLEDFMHGGKFYIKTVKGTKYIIFKGAPNARNYIKGVRYRADNPKLKILNLVAKPGEDNPAGFMKRIGTKMVDMGKEYRLGFVLIAGEDILQYYAKPENKRHFSDLVASLGLDMGNYVVANIAADAIVGLVVALAAPVEIAAGAAISVAFVGLLVAAGINWGLDTLEEELGVKKFVDEMASKCEHFFQEYWPEILESLTDQEGAPLAGDAF